MDNYSESSSRKDSYSRRSQSKTCGRSKCKDDEHAKFHDPAFASIVDSYSLCFSALKKPELKSRRVFRGHLSKVFSAGWFFNDSLCFVSGGQDGKLIVWDATTGNKRHAVFCKSVWLTSCGVSPSGRMICAGDLHNECTVFKLTDSFSEEPVGAERDASQPISAAAHALSWPGADRKRPEGVSGGGLRGEAAAAAVDREVLSDYVLYKELHGHVGFITACKFMAEDSLVTSSSDGTVAVWDVETQRRMLSFAEHTQDVSGVSLLPARSLVVSASFDGSCRLFDVRQKAAVAVFGRRGGGGGGLRCSSRRDSLAGPSPVDFTCIDFVPQGDQFVAGAADGVCTLFDVGMRIEMASFAAAPFSSSSAAAMPVDAQSCATSSLFLPYKEEIGAVCTSTSGRLLFAASEGAEICVWDTLTGENVATLVGHENKVSSLQLSPDGYALLSASWDGQLRLWF